MRKLVLLFLFVIAQQAISFCQSGGSGLILNQTYPINSLSPGALHTLRIATLQSIYPANGAPPFTSDHLHLVLTIGNSNTQPTPNPVPGTSALFSDSYIDAVFSNHGSFSYQYTLRGLSLPSSGAPPIMKVIAYRNPDSSVDIYLVLFSQNAAPPTATYTILENLAETVYSSPIDVGTSSPPGTLVFDSSNPLFPPSSILDSTNNFSLGGSLSVGGTLGSAPSTGLSTGLYLYSSADMTNYQRLAILPASACCDGLFQITPQRAGSAPTTGLEFYSDTNNSQAGSLRFGTAGSGANTDLSTFDFIAGQGPGIVSPGWTGFRLAPTFQVSSGNNRFLSILGGVNQSGTAGYTALFINTAEAGKGSGPRYLIDAQTGGADRFNVTADGNVGIGTTTPVAGTGNLSVSGNITANNITAGGYIYFKDNTYQSTAATPLNGPALPANIVSSSLASVGTITTGTWQGSPIVSSYLPADIVYTDKTQLIVGQTSFAANVGVGTATPAATLDVNGDVLVRGRLTFPDGSNFSSANPTVPRNFSVGQGGSGGLIVTADNLDPNNGHSLSGLANSAHLLLGWNYSGGGGEQDLIGNRGGGGSGGFAFYDYGNDGTLSKLAGLSGSGLSLNGSVSLASGSGASITFPDQTMQSTAWTGVLSGGDYAESVNVSGDRGEYEPGDVLVIDPRSEGNFLKSSAPYSTAVTGIYSTKPGIIGRRQPTAKAHMREEVPMAMTGIVPTKVSAENGSIRPGDLLVTSSTLGYAMKGTNRSQMLGAVIGKAIGHLDLGTGIIEAVVTLQ